MNRWTRREFVHGVAGVVALPRWWSQPGNAGYAYVASAHNTIHVFAVKGEQWKPVQQVASVAPAAIALSGDTLYAANDVALYDRLPRGSVEWFAIASNGRLVPAGRVGLSLSATHPRSLAVSPNGRWLAVASYSEGIYNLFAIESGGSLSAPSGIFKDIGCAHPTAVHFDATGSQLVGTAAVSDRPAVFTMQDGRLTRTEETVVARATPPVTIVGDSIYYRAAKVADVPAAINVALRT